MDIAFLIFIRQLSLYIYIYIVSRPLRVFNYFLNYVQSSPSPTHTPGYWNIMLLITRKSLSSLLKKLKFKSEPQASVHRLEML